MAKLSGSTEAAFKRLIKKTEKACVYYHKGRLVPKEMEEILENGNNDYGVVAMGGLGKLYFCFKNLSSEKTKAEWAAYFSGISRKPRL